VDVYLSTGRHWLDTDVAVTIQIGIGAYVLMMMGVVLHCHSQGKSWRATARGFAGRKHSWNNELRDQHNQYQGKYEFLEHSVSFYF